MGKAELLYRFKGTPQSPLPSVFKTSPCISSHQQEFHQLKGPLGNPQSPLGVLYTTRHCILVWILSTASFLTPNERESAGEGREGGDVWAWEEVRAKAEELFGYLPTTAGKGEREKFMGSR